MQDELGDYEILHKGKKVITKFKSQSLTAISAAFGFLIALSWREPISDSVEMLVNYFGMTGDLIYYKFVSAILVTAIAVGCLMIINKFKQEEK